MGLKNVGGEWWGSVLLLGRHLLRFQTHKKTTKENKIDERFSVETKVESQENRTKN